MATSDIRNPGSGAAGERSGKQAAGSLAQKQRAQKPRPVLQPGDTSSGQIQMEDESDFDLEQQEQNDIDNDMDTGTKR